MGINLLSTQKAALSLRNFCTVGEDTLVCTCVHTNQLRIFTVNCRDNNNTANLDYSIPGESVSSVLATSEKGLIIGGVEGSLLATRTVDEINVQNIWDRSAVMKAHAGKVDVIIENSFGGYLTYSNTDNCLNAWAPKGTLSLSQIDYQNLLPFLQSTAYCFDSTLSKILICTGKSLMLMNLDSFEAVPLTIEAHLEGHVNYPPEDVDFSSISQVSLLCEDKFAVFSDNIHLFVLEMDNGRLIVKAEKPALWTPYIDNNTLLSVSKIKMKDVSSANNYFMLEVLSLPNLRVLKSKRALPPLTVGSKKWDLSGIRLSSSGSYVVLMYSVRDVTPALYYIFSVNLHSAGSEVVSCVSSEQGGRKRVGAIEEHQPIHSVFVLPEDNILIGGLGDLPQWDLGSGSCRVKRVAYFHTWFKHSTTINLSRHRNVNKDKFDYYPITVLSVSREASLIASGCSRGSMIVWNQALLLSLNGAEPDKFQVRASRVYIHSHHEGAVSGLVLSGEMGTKLPQGLLISCGEDQCVQVHCAATGKLFHRVRCHMILSFPRLSQSQPVRLLAIDSRNSHLVFFDVGRWVTEAESAQA